MVAITQVSTNLNIRDVLILFALGFAQLTTVYDRFPIIARRYSSPTIPPIAPL